MELIVISNSAKSKSEIPTLIKLFERGLDIFHVKKSKWSTSKMKDYLKAIPSPYHDRLVLHSHHLLAMKFKVRGIHIGKRQRSKRFRTFCTLCIVRLFRPRIKVSTSFYHIHDLIADTRNYDYAFLKPVFDRHGTRLFSSLFSQRQLTTVLQKTKHKVLALGGVKPERVAMARTCGFNGVALQATFWNKHENRFEFYDAVREACALDDDVRPDLEYKAVKISM